MTREEAIEVYNGLINEKIKEAFEFFAPELAESEDERIRKEIVFIVKQYGRICEKEGDPCCTINDCLAYLEKQKEQKPEEVDESTKRLNDNWMKQHFDDSEEQKPAEWSEEDEEMLEEIINHIDTTSVQRIPARPGSAIGKSWIKFLKSIRPQPKQEWSEEDEDMLNCCISSIEEAKENRYAYKETDGDTSYDHEIDWLKSLRPQYHGDVTMTEAYKMGLEAGKASSWKPSEEQMEAFRSYIKDFQEKAEAAVGGWNNFDVMIRLFEQLKKLGAKEEPEYYQHFDPDC